MPGLNVQPEKPGPGRVLQVRDLHTVTVFVTAEQLKLCTCCLIGSRKFRESTALLRRISKFFIREKISKTPYYITSYTLSEFT